MTKLFKILLLHLLISIATYGQDLKLRLTIDVVQKKSTNIKITYSESELVLSGSDFRLEYPIQQVVSIKYTDSGNPNKTITNSESDIKIKIIAGSLIFTGYNSEDKVYIKISDCLGRVLFSTQQALSNQIPLNNLRPSFYILSIDNFIIKFILK